MKLCKRCNTSKEILEFSNKKRSKDGLNPWCKLCTKEYLVEYNQKNKEKLSKQRSDRYFSNPESAKLRAKIQREDKEKTSTYQKEYYINNKENLLEYRKKWYQNNNESVRKRVKENQKDNPEYLEYLKNWRTENSEYCREYLKEWNLKNSGKNKEYRENYNRRYPHVVAWRSCLWGTITRIGKSKDDSTLNLMGYTANDLRIHIESLFKEGMSWSNWGEWHVDHVIPVTKFDPETPINVVNALSNLQPLWAAENLSKNNRI